MKLFSGLAFPKGTNYTAQTSPYKNVTSPPTHPLKTLTGQRHSLESWDPSRESPHHSDVC